MLQYCRNNQPVLVDLRITSDSSDYSLPVGITKTRSSLKARPPLQPRFQLDQSAFFTVFNAMPRVIPVPKNGLKQISFLLGHENCPKRKKGPLDTVKTEGENPESLENKGFPEIS